MSGATGSAPSTRASRTSGACPFGLSPSRFASRGAPITFHVAALSNLGLFALPKVGGMEIEVTHNHFESHHASGPQDNAGKDPRKAMDRAIQHRKSETIYDYHR